MTKVVINACFGGFSLSAQAIAWLKERGVTAKSDFDIECWYGRERHDPLLVECVEALGSRASGSTAALRIEEVDGPYRVCEYDGNERVETPGEIKWVTP